MDITLIWIIVSAAVSLGQFAKCEPTSTSRPMKNFAHGHELGLIPNEVVIVARRAARGGNDTELGSIHHERNDKIARGGNDQEATSDWMSGIPRKRKRKRKMRMIRHKRWWSSDIKPLVENADQIADDLLKHGHKAMREHHSRERLETATARRATFAICFAIMGGCFICTVFTVKKLCSYE